MIIWLYKIIICIIISQKTPNNRYVVKCSRDMRCLNNQILEKVSYIQTYLYDLGF